MRRFRFTFVVAVSVLICLAAVLSFSLLFITLSQKRSVPNERRIKEYQYLHHNKRTHETKRGITSQSEISGSRGYLFYENDDSYVLISEFGSTEYECGGICYCENRDERSRRISKSVAKRSFTYLVAAINTILATNYAREYFGKLCKEEMSGFCDQESSAILSEVNSCDEMKTDDVEYPHSEREDGFEVEDFGEETQIFWCKGHCLPNIYGQEFTFHEDFKYYKIDEIYLLGYYEKKKAKEFGCEKLSCETEVWVDPSEYKDTKMRQPIVEEAYKLFIEDYLEEFCIQNSIIEGTDMCGCSNFKDCDYPEYEFSVGNLDEEDVDGNRIKRVKELCFEKCKIRRERKDNIWWCKKPMCVSNDYGLKSGDIDRLMISQEKHVDNESVVCRSMDQKTRTFRQFKKSLPKEDDDD